MGINTHYYTIYGVKVHSYDDELSDALYGDGELYLTVEGNPSLDIIMDGLGGEYMILGKILFDSGDLRWHDIKDSFVEIDISRLTDYRLDAVGEMQKLLPDFVHYLDREWKIMTLVHYS